MSNQDGPRVIWTSETVGGVIFRIVLPSPRAEPKFAKFERRHREDYDAMGNERWEEAHYGEDHATDVLVHELVRRLI